jgi:hypothetical protein
MDNIVLPKINPVLIADLLLHKITAHRTKLYTNKDPSKTINNVATTILHKLKEEEERHSCWCFVLIGEIGFEAKIVHKEEVSSKF